MSDELHCTIVSEDSDVDYPANCPVCGGFIKWVWNEKGKEYEPKCNKCHAELMLLPYSEDGEVIEGGEKICPLSMRRLGAE